MNEQRVADFELTVIDADGQAVALADVVVAQIDHAFRFRRSSLRPAIWTRNCETP